MADMKSWHWILIGLGSVMTLLFFTSGFIYYRQKKKRSLTLNESQQEKGIEIIPDETIFRRNETESNMFDEGIIIANQPMSKLSMQQQQQQQEFNYHRQDKVNKQQFAILTSVQNGLSPPKQQRTINSVVVAEEEEEEKNTATTTTTTILYSVPIIGQQQERIKIKKEEKEEEDNEMVEKNTSKKLRVFSLSPMHLTLSESPCSEGRTSSSSSSSSCHPNNYSSVSSHGDSTTYRTVTTLTPYNLNELDWRGPTPPWTQHYPGHNED